jgi:hypothetical protein
MPSSSLKFVPYTITDAILAEAPEAAATVEG